MRAEPSRFAPGTAGLSVADPTATSICNEQGVSRRHCTVENSGFTVTVTDLESVNGTFVNGKAVVRRAVLQAGDELSVGPVVLTCRALLLPLPGPGADEPARLVLREEESSSIAPQGGGHRPPLDPVVGCGHSRSSGARAAEPGDGVRRLRDDRPRRGHAQPPPEHHRRDLPEHRRRPRRAPAAGAQRRRARQPAHRGRAGAARRFGSRRRLQPSVAP